MSDAINTKHLSQGQTFNTVVIYLPQSVYMDLKFRSCILIKLNNLYNRVIEYNLCLTLCINKSKYIIS